MEVLHGREEKLCKYNRTKKRRIKRNNRTKQKKEIR